MERISQQLPRPNIPLSATNAGRIVESSTHTPYVPPHPQQGTPYHRYAFLLLPQEKHLDIPRFTDEQRLGFNYREFAEEYGFDGSLGGGGHMFREVWDPTVSHIYEHTLSE